MPQFSKSSTSAVRVNLGFQGILGMVSTGVASALPSGGVVHSGSSGVGKGMSIHRWGCSSVVTLELLCSGSGKSRLTNWSHPFKPTGYTTHGPPDRSWQTLSWLICPWGLSSAFPWGKMPRCLSLGRGVWLEPSYNCVKTYGQLGPLEMQAARSLMPSPSWISESDGDFSTQGPCHNSQPPNHPLYALEDRPYHYGAPEHLPRL